MSPWINGDLLTPSNLNNKQIPVFNLFDYGAVGNGLNDDTDAVAAALAAAIAEGGMLQIPYGTFLISERLTGTAFCTIQGTGWNSVLKLASGVEDHILIFSNQATAVQGLVLRDFCVDGNGGGPDGSGLVQVNHAPFFDIQHLWIKNAGTVGEPDCNGISIASGVGHPVASGSITACLVEDTTKAGINYTGRSENVLIGWNTVRRCSGDGNASGISCDSGAGLTVFSNWVSQCEGSGIVPAITAGQLDWPAKNSLIMANRCWENGQGESATNLSGISVVGRSPVIDWHIDIVDNHCWDNGLDVTATTGRGIEVDLVRYITLRGNRCHGNRADGIEVRRSEYVSISDNECYNNNAEDDGAGDIGNGITLRDVEHFRVHDNDCFDSQGSPTQKYGIGFITDVSNRGSVKNNWCYPNKTGAIFTGVNPTNTKWVDNDTEDGELFAHGTDETQVIQTRILVAEVDTGEIAADDYEVEIITFTGIDTTWAIQGSPRAAIEDGLAWDVHVNTDDQIRVRLWNHTGSPITPAARNWNFVATKVA